MIKITEKTNKQELINFLGEVKVKDKNLMERINYALNMVKKDLTKVAKTDLLELAQEAVALLTPAPAPVEASLKPKKLGKKSEKTEEVDTKEPKKEPKEEKKPAPKTSGKTTAKEADKVAEDKKEVETIPPVSTKGLDSLPSAKIFPARINHPDLGELVACTGHYTTYKEVLAALEAGKTLYFACYWTKRQIKEFAYEATKMVKAPKEGFPNDLDILMAVLPCETIERVFAMSRYTEALFQFEGEDFMPLEDIDPRSGDRFQIRVSAGLEFEIYRPADEEILEA